MLAAGKATISPFLCPRSSFSCSANLFDHLPVGVSSQKKSIPSATAVMTIKGTIYATRHALCGVRPALYTNESKIAGITKLQEGNISTDASSNCTITYYVIPPPAFPHPPAKALAVPTTFLSKKPVHQTWQGTKVAPRMPTKKRKAINPLGVVTRPAMAVGIAPHKSVPIKTHRGPNRSQSGPHMNRTRRLTKIISCSFAFPANTFTHVASKATMFEFATSSWVISKSFRMVMLNLKVRGFE